ncbi:MAG: DUF1207 domain-containing protein [Pirellulales bacterium]|nr:DUF1207 domain-containing protein [Pirellulales bacterium]
MQPTKPSLRKIWRWSWVFAPGLCCTLLPAQSLPPGNSLSASPVSASPANLSGPPPLVTDPTGANQQSQTEYWQAAGQPQPAEPSLLKSHFPSQFDGGGERSAAQNAAAAAVLPRNGWRPISAESDNWSLDQPQSDPLAASAGEPAGVNGDNGSQGEEPWSVQWLPEGLIYRSYLAGDRESRFRGFFFHEKDYGWLWDITLGGRVGLWRYGNTDAYFPEGWQIDLEGAALPRLDFMHDMNLVSVDFRAGLPITYGVGPWKTKMGYYHLSSHLGDEHMLTFPSVPRYNYARDVLIFGQSYYYTPEHRIYAEVGWAFFTDVSGEWEMQLGWEYAPAVPTGPRGAPFVALHGHLREEVNYSGNFVTQVGWAWRDGPSARLFRVGFEYFNGLSDQYQFWNLFEEKLGLGLWYDF